MPILTDVPVCACVSSREEKKKRRNRADHLSLSGALSSEIEFSSSAIVVVFVSGDRMVRFFSNAVLHYRIYFQFYRSVIAVSQCHFV